MLNIILIVIMAICLAMILFIVWDKLAKVSAVNYQATKTAKQISVKRRLLEERLQRKFSQAGARINQAVSPLSGWLAGAVQSWYQKAMAWEESYRHKVLRDSFKDQVATGQHAGQLLEMAKALLEQSDVRGAEKKFIAVLKLDQANLEAYQGLGELYLLEEDLDHARETFEFLLKLDKNNVNAHRSLGQVQAAKGDLKAAEQSYVALLALDKTNANAHLELAEIYLQLEQADRAFDLANQAAALEPANPKVLDFLIEVSIITRDRQAALKAWRLLKEVNPENHKLDEFKERIEKL